jgi:putative acetyltransferase
MIRRYKVGDEPFIYKIFQDAIYQIASHDYSQAQLDVWVNSLNSVEDWKKRCGEKQPYIYESEGKIAGFIELDDNGYIDCTYVLPEFYKKGVMSKLMCFVKQEAITMGNLKLFSEVSITAKPFFEKHGFKSTKENIVNKNGVSLTNYSMECNLA